MRVFTTLPQEDLTAVGAAATAAEAAGFDGLMTMENRHDPFLALAVAATATSRIQLMTGIAIAFSRSPMTVANAGWDLQAGSRGRFVIGLGSQVRAHNERRFSVPWSAPAPRLREYVLALRAIYRCWKHGEKLAFEGEHYRFTLMTPNFVPEAMDAPPPPITIAAVGPAMLRVAGEVCDGVRLHPFCTRRYIEEAVLPRLREGFAKSGRRRGNFEITGGGFIATGPDSAAVARMREWVRVRVGFYGSTPAYWPVLELHGHGDLGRELNELSRKGQWTEMTKAISDDVLEPFCAAGTHQEIAGVIEQRFAGLSDAIMASANSAVPSDMPSDLLRDIQRLPTAFQGYA